MMNSNKEKRLIDVKQIVFIRAKNINSCVYLSSGEWAFATPSIGAFEEHLKDQYFFRSHRSYLVNLDNLDSINWVDNRLMMKFFFHEIPLSRKRKMRLKKILEIPKLS